MADEGFKRKLAAILSADVEGYSRLMDDDEEATVRTLTAYRTAIADLAQKFRGRIVDTPGDNILAEFVSVVDSVNCAAEIQRDLAEKNADLPESRRMQFRIGVNLGDVIDEEDRIYGDGVNIAARVEAMADAGGVCISGRVFDQVANKLELEYEYLGEHQVKNIRTPIRVYRLLSYPGAAAHRVVQAKESLGKKWRKIAISAAGVVVVAIALGFWLSYTHRPVIEPASVDKMAFPLPEKPSIAVLPFANMTEDPRQEYLSDGITEQIISTLSKVPSMFVIARTSTFAYKGKPVKVQQISQDLGVRYVLEGSVQRSGDRVRITAQLIDAIDGKHLWAQRYDRELKDIFILQDEITLKIIRALRVKLTEGEQVNIWRKNAPSNVEYVEKLFEAQFYGNEFNKESNEKAKQLLKEAIDLEPEYWAAYVGLAMTHNIDVWMGSSSSPHESLGKAFKLCQKAISLDEKQDLPHLVIGNIYLLNRKYDLAIKEGKRAIALNPNSAEGYVYLGQSLSYSGRTEEGIESIKKGMRLSPFPNSWYIWNLAIAYREAGRYEESIVEYRRALKLRPNNGLAYMAMSMTYAMAGRFEEAHEAYSEAIKINSEYSFEKILKTIPFRPEKIELIRAALQKAGLPFKPPLPLPDKPSIAVLAFDNLSGDPAQEYFSDGITEEIISALSKTDQLFVIARNSSFVYKGKPVNVKQVSRELGVRYVLEGSVRKSEDRVRITAQLIDATSGHHLWSERYDRELKDIFAVQDEVTMKIITALQVELTDGEQMRIWAKRIKRLDVLLKGMESASVSRKGTQESVIRWGQVAQEIVDMAPELPVGYRHLGWYHYFLAAWGKSPRENLKKAYGFALKAISLDEYDGMSHGLLGNVYLTMRQHEKAIAAGKRAIELDPNGADVHMYLGYTLNFAGRPDEALGYLNKANRLNPFPPYYIPKAMGHSYLLKGNYEKALTEYKKALELAPKAPEVYARLAVIYILLGREGEAHASAEKALELYPNASVSLFAKSAPYKIQANLELILDAMRKAGFPEGA